MDEQRGMAQEIGYRTTDTSRRRGHCVKRSLRWILGNCRHFEDSNAPTRVGENQIGKRASDVDTNPP